MQYACKVCYHTCVLCVFFEIARDTDICMMLDGVRVDTNGATPTDSHVARSTKPVSPHPGLISCSRGLGGFSHVFTLHAYITAPSRHRGPYHAPKAPNIPNPTHRGHRPWRWSWTGPVLPPPDANHLHTIAAQRAHGVHVTHRSQHGAPRAPQIRGNIQVRRWLRSVPL